MEQNIIQIGNSLGVTIPSELRKKMGLKKGSKVVMEHTPDNKIIISEIKDSKKMSSITPEFLKWLDRFNKEYGPALTELAKG